MRDLNLQWSRLAAALAFGMSIGLGGAALAATSANSAWRDAGSVGGHSYENRASVHVDYGTNAQGETRIRTVNGSTVGPGNMGAKPYLYRWHPGGTYTLCVTQAYYYNPSNNTGIASNTTGGDCGPGTYASFGESRARRSDGTYKEVETWKTSGLYQNS